ncbi:DUF1345 domain-containing protein [Amycolatopsis umgeniensis]|uniref:Putative membrane protein n=1 Tax=Amycolatopsis umgeniensis TaxID=336628 RepID=A0A841BGI7_9PSEU|nr:putative membrane protein [Amycolatopsis umgeniensis]
MLGDDDGVMRKLMLLLELLLAVLGVVWLVSFLRDGSSLVPLLVWDVVAIGYLVTGWLEMRRELPAHTPEDLRSLAGPRWYTQLFALVISCSGLAGGLMVIANRGEDEINQAAQAIAAATILLSWLLLHSAFAQIYAREYAADRGLDFPECPVPQFTEFLYFAITIGTSFAVSDVTVTSRPMRRRVIVHSVVSFFFNAALIAIAIDWLKG